MGNPLLQVDQVTKVYKKRRMLHGVGAEVAVLRGVSLSIARGKTLALIGESGSGKSTLAKCIVQLEPVTSGSVSFDGVELTRLDRRQLGAFWPRMQLVFQGASAAVNPNMRSWEVVAEPLRIQARGTRAWRKSAALNCMGQMGISPDLAERFPYQLSGGQLQRLVVARALVLAPELLVLDEPFSGLDVSIQAQIANLLMELQRERSLTYVVIAHDLVMAGVLADEIAVMQDGELVERGPVETVYAAPQHPYAQALVAATFRGGAERMHPGGID